MKTFRYTYIVLLIALTAVIAGCSSDDEAAASDVQKVVSVTLRIGVDNGSSVTRTWDDVNAKTDRTEMMYSWYVVLTDANNKVVYKNSSTSVTDANAEKDVVETRLELNTGTYYAYSFANIPEESLPSTITSTGVGRTLDAAAVMAAGASVSGNNFVPSATQGIPMSNKQTLTISANTREIDLIVVRMMAKMKISVTNETGAEQYIKYATITGITDNVANNLKLLPNYINASSANTMEAVHGDIQPNLNGTPATVELAIPGMATTEALANNATREVTFYINECKKPTDFELTIGLGNASSTQEYRYALIDNKGATTADDDKWDYIARNDYRIIPIVLDDYKLELIPYDFPPIGVYPVSVSTVDETNHIYAFTFHDYGHFHLLPSVTHNGSGNTRESVPFTATAPTGSNYTSSAWGFVTDGDFTSSWGSWTDVTKTTTYDNATADPAFYRKGDNTSIDGDEAGGIPVWYANTSSPQWDPAGGTNYRPFIFGYIAELEEAPIEDYKVYHEFTIKLYKKGTSAPRLMTYRFYMILSVDQMLYPPVSPSGSRATTPMPRKRH